MPNRLFAAPLATAALLLSGCAAPGPGGPGPDRPPDLLYTVTVGEDLRRLEVRVDFRGLPPAALAAPGDPLGAGIEDARVLPGGAPLEAGADGRSLRTDSVPAGGSAAWAVPLPGPGTRPVPGGGIATSASPADREIATWTTGAWLLGPSPPGRGLAARVRFVLPEGCEVLVPWAEAEGSGGREFLLGPEAFLRESRIAFGRMSVASVRAGGARLRVGMPRVWPFAASREGVAAWISRAGEAVSGLFGRFPAPGTAVFLEPAFGRDGDPVVFGNARGGPGSSVLLLLSRSATDADLLRDDWVAIHEMLHLGMPFVPDGDDWLAEGWVTYYQEVLRARVGLRDEAAAWGEILDGFERGRRSGGRRTLEEESRAMRANHAYHSVYWAGAAVALRLDVALRNSTGGRISLDDAVREMSSWRGEGPVTAREAMDRLDAWLGRPLFSSVAEECLASAEFPRVDGLLGRLGVIREGGRVRLDDAAPEAAVRRAITAPDGAGATR